MQPAPQGALPKVPTPDAQAVDDSLDSATGITSTETAGTSSQDQQAFLDDKVAVSSSRQVAAAVARF